MASADADARQAATYARLDHAVEDAVGRPLTLGGLRQDALASDLADEDRLSLLGRIDTYLGDEERATDPWERHAAGDGPRPDDDVPQAPIVGAADDAEDAMLDLEDGFTPSELPPA